MASSAPEILTAAHALFDLAKNRDIAARNYDDHKSKLSDEYYTITDGEYLEMVHSAYVKRNNLAKRVLEESEAFFNILPEPLQFGIQELGKPLILPKVGPFNPAAARCLVVTLKPVEAKDKVLLAPAKPEYSFDVKIVDLSSK